MALNTSLKVTLSAALAKALDMVTGSVPLSKEALYALASGTGANQADKVYSKTITLAASGTTTFDLNGSLFDNFGDTFNLARLKVILLVAAGGNTNDCQLTRPASGVPFLGATGDFIPVRPGGLALVVCPDATGYAIAGGSTDQLTVTNSAGGTSVTYDIILIGASA